MLLRPNAAKGESNMELPCNKTKRRGLPPGAETASNVFSQPDQRGTPHQPRTPSFLPVGLSVITISIFLPQFLQSWAACFASWRAATLVLDFLPSAICTSLLG